MAAVFRSPFYAPRGAIDGDAKWQGSPGRAVALAMLTANMPDGAGFYAPRGLAESYSSSGPLGVNRALATPAAVSPLTLPAYRFHRAEDPGWLGAPQGSDALVMLVAGGAPGHRQWRWDMVAEPVWTGAPQGSDALVMLASNGRPFAKRWRYDVVAEPNWNWRAPGSQALSSAPQVAAPTKSWRYDLVPDTAWQGSPQGSDAIVMLSAGGQPPTKAWRYDLAPETFWSWAVPQRDLSLSLTPLAAAPTKLWRYDLAPESFWQGAPQSAAVISLLTYSGKPFAKFWRRDLAETPAWQWMPANGSLLLPSLSSPATARFWRYDAAPDATWQPSLARNAALLGAAPFAARAWRYDYDAPIGWQGAPSGNVTALYAPPPPTLPFRSLWRPDYASDVSLWSWSPQNVRAIALFNSAGLYGHAVQFLSAIAQKTQQLSAIAEAITQLRGVFGVPALGQDVTIRQGDSRTLVFPIRLPDGTNPTFSSPSCSFVVTKTYDKGPDLLTKTGLTPTQNSLAWSVSVGLSAADAAGIPVGRWFLQLRLQDTDGTEVTLAVGFFTVLPIRPTP